MRHIVGQKSDGCIDVSSLHKVLESRGIVVMNFDCYTGDRGSIPAHGDSLGK